LPVLGDAAIARAVGAAGAVQAEPEAVALTTLRGEAAYVRSGSNVGAWSARTGQALLPVSAQRAEASAAQFAGGQASLVRCAWMRTAGRIRARWMRIGRCIGSRWAARSRGMYVSSHTGEVVLDAPHVQQRWNYVGAWLHWLYFLRMQSVDPVWTWVVIVLSALCTVAAISGIVVGVWRWRFRGHYRSGAKTPYVEPWMRWHHLIGLVAAAFVFTWIFSGLMSMNPLGVFSSTREAIDSGRYRGGAVAVDGALGEPAALLAAGDARFRPVEIQWRRIGGELFAVLLDGQGDTRIVSGSNGQLQVARLLPARGCSRRCVRCRMRPCRGSWSSSQRMPTSIRVRPRP
jgi:hypothetical protein